MEYSSMCEVIERMSISDEINKIQPQKLASDLPDSFTATVKTMTRDIKKGQYAGAPLLKLELTLDTGETITTNYRIPKAWTGKGQMDKLMLNLKGLGLSLDEMIGKTFVWTRQPLDGSIAGFERHYPTKIVKPSRAK